MYIFVSLILKFVSLLLVCFWLLCKCNVWVDDCGSGAAEPKMIQIPILPDKRNGYVWVDESERETNFHKKLLFALAAFRTRQTNGRVDWDV